MSLYSIFRVSVFSVLLVLVAACGKKYDPNAPLEPMGDFSLGYAVVVDDQAQIGPLSRKADPGTWKKTLTEEVKKELGRYEGDKIYHLGIKVDGYVLAIPGVPLVVSPKSALIVSVSVWDDAKREKITPEPKQLTVLESFSGNTLIGSGLTQSKKRQMRNLSRNMAVAIHKYLLKNPEWFGLPPLPEPVEKPAQGSNGDN